MNSEQTKSISAVQDVLEMLLVEAESVGAEELAFYIGLSIQAAKDHLALE